MARQATVFGRRGTRTVTMFGPNVVQAGEHPAEPDVDATDRQGSAGLRVRRAGGRKPGRRPKLSRQQQAAMVDAVLSGQRTAAQMARYYKVSEPTVSRILAAHRAGAGSSVSVIEESGEERVVGVLPLTALDERLAVVGTSGSGKTYATKGLVERLMDGGARVCVVDPLGVWWGLRASPDGITPARHPVVVFGGQHADIPLAPSHGAALGRLIGSHALACVVDVSDLGSAAARRGFMTAFTEALYDSNAEPLHLVLDEADLWAPQRVPLDSYDLLGRIEEIVRRGRVRGFVPWLITQRPAVLHKDVLSQADILVSMKLTSSQDRAAVGRWIEGQADRAEGRRILAALPQLGRGEGWVWAPSSDVLARVRFPTIKTFDSSGTPSRRERHTPTGGPRLPVDLASLSAVLDVGQAEHADLDVDRGQQIRLLEQRLRERDEELAAALARIDALQAVVEARAQQD